MSNTMNTYLKHLLITLILTLTMTSQSWSQDTWVKTFDNVSNISSITSTFQGGVLITGDLFNDVFIMELDSDGEILWSRTIGGTGPERGQSITTTSSGDVLVTGWTFSNDGDFNGIEKGGGDIFVTKLDKDGRIMWIKTLGGSGGGGNESGQSLTTLPDGSVLVTGSFSSNDGDFDGINRGESDIFVTKLDKDGNTKWLKSFGGTGWENGNSVTTTSEGNILITGTTISNDGDFEGMNMGLGDIFVIKLDKNGDVLWKKVFGGIKDDGGISVRTNSKNEVLITGVFSSNNGSFRGLNRGENDVVVINLDSDGQEQWKKTIGGSGVDDCSSISTSSDGGLFVTGFSFSNDGDFKGMNKGESDTYIVKLDGDGKIVWTRMYGGKGGEGSEGIVSNPDGTLLMGGKTHSDDGHFLGIPKSKLDVFVMKLDSNGNLKPSGQKKSKKK